MSGMPISCKTSMMQQGNADSHSNSNTIRIPQLQVKLMYVLIMAQTIIIALASRDNINKMLHGQGRNQNQQPTSQPATAQTNKQTKQGLVLANIA
jgi:hypothetical protein